MTKALKRSAGLIMYRRLKHKLVHPGGPFWAKKDQGAQGRGLSVYVNVDGAPSGKLGVVATLDKSRGEFQ